MNQFHALKVSAIQRLTPDSVRLTLDIPADLKSDFSFLPGQYLSLETEIGGQSVRRAYSICSASEQTALEVGVKKVPNGVFSSFVNDQLAVGDQLSVHLPEGRFVLDPSVESGTYCAFASGSGITPVLSMIKSALKASDLNKFVLVYGNRSLNDTMFRSDLEELLTSYPERFKIEWMYSREKQNNALFGRIQRSVVNYLLKNKYSEWNFDKFFICGPGEMIDEVADTLAERGIDQDAILFERFTASEEGEEVAGAEGQIEMTVIVDDETDNFSCTSGTTILQAVLDQGIDAPYSCQGGICSSCIAKVTEGRAEMQKNQILTDAEVADGLVLTCQAVPVTQKVVVDYDDV
ncbi:ferredoxin--NADP reductase [Aureitalea marina]|uniref:Flavodoxin reductase n=1 Tax=Aureitalea marina TaxID=930804 RepID=A0A2S7KS90_9FLAO|nr:ferredoxin--NADP reductase [Aureitalea marina]PQB05501.1 flavodoxin reductase [Aureitalea marina]